MPRRSGEDRRKGDRRDPNNTMMDLIQKWLDKSPSERDDDFERHKHKAETAAWRDRILRGQDTDSAICTACELPFPLSAFRKDARLPGGRTKHCISCRSYKGSRKRKADALATALNQNKGDDQ